ncbi:uncharacterized protein LOC105436836 [Strongylocentrotus purpuratus]|uniref:Uncharacterized protein n=1 Tax=Strongylocentrotus purpuratus TaxID=7668 RepID=A0A7M7PJD8_STRPU|nr:uncharacterized protein LOC105436836 [Strongylocentrotus purpuratus]
MPCKNNGTCVDGTDYYECYCLQGFNGANCEIEVAELANPGYSNVLSMELQLMWDFPVQGNDDDINCTAKYRIQGTNKTEDKNVGSTSPGIVTVLEPYTIYEFQLICVNLAGSSEPLDFPPQRTLAGKPSQPQNVRISSIQAREVFVEWDEPADKNGPIDGYSLIARRRDLNNVAFSGLGSGTSGIFIQLTPNTVYTVSVKVFNRNAPEGNQFSEESPHSDPFTTLQAESSGTPVTLTIVSVTVILVLICVIMMFICIRKRKRSQQQGNRSSPIASASFTTTPRMCTHLLPANSPTSSGKQQVDDVYHEYERVCVCGQDSSKSSTRANQGTSQGISLTKTKSTSENDQSHDYENPSFDDKEYTNLGFSQVKKGGDPTKPTSSGKEYTDLDFSKIE